MNEQQKQAEVLSVEEQDAIGKAVFLMVKEYPALPVGTSIKYGDIAGNAIGIIPQQGAVVKKRYISGSFTAQFPFMLLYRSKPTTDNDRIAREETLGNMARWLSGKKVVINGKDCVLNGYPQLSEGRNITEIEAVKTVSLIGKLDDGSVDYGVQLMLTYKKRDEERNF